MEIRTLGGLAVRVGAEELSLGTPKQRTVLAVLALHAGQLVTVDRMVDELWPDDPPRSAVPNVRTYAANLRRAFEVAGPDAPQVVRESGGYRLLADKDSIDVIRLLADCAEATSLARAGRQEPAVALLTRAVDAWRGPLLAGLPLGPTLRARREAVEQERCAAIELLAELHIDAGRPELAVRVLRTQAPAEPVRERAAALLMRALLRTGEVAGAIAVYQATRQALAEQFAVAPGDELERLHRAAVAARRRSSRGADHSRPAGRPPVEPGHTGPTVNWLPRAVPDFVGREDVLTRLLNDTARDSPNASLVRVIDGMPGCGKTTLAVHLATRLAPVYPDAQLFIDLRGHGDAPPLDPSAVLLTLLRQLGVAAGRVPSGRNARIELWRRELSRRRTVIVLDNAASSEQVMPLLPTGPGTVVLVTARRRLFAAGAGVPESLSVLTPEEAVELLAVTAGPGRVGAEPEAALEVVRRCGHLPLAIRLAGARLAHRTSWRVADLAQQLASGRGALDQIVVEHRTVAEAFSTSYTPLGKRMRHAFRMLALYPGDAFSLPMAAALADLPLDEAARTVDELVDRHLLEEVGSGRYRLHDLMRQYASELSRRLDRPQDRWEAGDRLLDLCLRATSTIAIRLEPALAEVRLAPDPPPRPELLDALGPLDVEWLERERANLTALVAFAESTGHDGWAWRLARALWRFCYMRSYFDDIVSTHRQGLAAAERSGDWAAAAAMKNFLASAYVRTSDYRTARDLLQSAIEMFRSVDDGGAVLRCRTNLSVIHWLCGDLAEAVRLGEELVREERRNRPWQLRFVLPNLGLALTVLGRYEEALRAHRMHLYQARLQGDQFHLLNALAHIGMVKVRLGRHAQAVRLLRASLMLRDRTGHRFGEPEVRADLGAALRGLGRLDEARQQHEIAVELATDNGERHVEGAALNELGLTLAAQGETDQAVRVHRRALELATRVAHPYEQGRALAALAGHLAVSEPAEARRLGQRALAIFDRMGVPEREEMRRRLAETAP
ncbi:AfsR/SARP family transcriptional regulator [Micromonospora coxensis]|uniref:AfsR/SARP family transcriptional regulator n=1 Tax=Micromonospora coxensis TaxID=356852 RepID=UPI0034163132